MIALSGLFLAMIYTSRFSSRIDTCINLLINKHVGAEGLRPWIIFALCSHFIFFPSLSQFALLPHISKTFPTVPPPPSLPPTPFSPSQPRLYLERLYLCGRDLEWLRYKERYSTVGCRVAGGGFPINLPPVKLCGALAYVWLLSVALVSGLSLWFKEQPWLCIASPQSFGTSKSQEFSIAAFPGQPWE